MIMGYQYTAMYAAAVILTLTQCVNPYPIPERSTHNYCANPTLDTLYCDDCYDIYKFCYAYIPASDALIKAPCKVKSGLSSKPIIFITGIL